MEEDARRVDDPDRARGEARVEARGRVGEDRLLGRSGRGLAPARGRLAQERLGALAPVAGRERAPRGALEEPVHRGGPRARIHGHGM